MNGALMIALMINPNGEWDADGGDQHTSLEIEPDEWEELFFKVLYAPQPKIYSDGEDIYEYDKQQERLFQENLLNKGYKMLGRIWNLYRDVKYFPSEVNQLLEECLEVKNKTQNPHALSALEKLITACNEALKIESGLFLGSD